MVQEDVAEDHNHQCDDHADVEGQIVGDLRIVDDLDHVGDEREVIALREGQRVGGDDGGKTTGQEHRRQGRDERLHVEFLDQGAGQQAEHSADEQHDDHDQEGGHAGVRQLQADDCGDGHDSTDRQIDTTGQNRQGHGHSQNNQVGVVNEQGGDEAQSNVGAEQRLTHDDHQDEDYHGREGRDHLTIELEALLGSLHFVCRSCCHAATALA